MTRLTRIAITITIFFGVLLSQDRMTYSQWVIGSTYPSPIPFQSPTLPLGLSPLLANPLLANPLAANPLLANPLAEPFGYTGLPSLGLAGYGQTWPASSALFPNPAGLASFPAQGIYQGTYPNLSNLYQSLYPNIYQNPYPSIYPSPYPNGVPQVASPLQANSPFVTIPNTAYSQGVVSPYSLYSNPLYSNPSVPPYSNPSTPPTSGYYPYSGYLASQGVPISSYPYSSYPSQGVPVPSNSYSSYPSQGVPVPSYPYSSYPSQGVPVSSYTPGYGYAANTYSSAPYSSALYPGLYNSASGFYNPASNTSQQQSEQGNNSNDDSQTSDSTSTQTASPAQVTGVWIGTWTASFASQQGESTSAASINLAQADTSVSGAFLFVGHSTINGISANGVVQGSNLQMTASTGESEANLTILFEGTVKGDTWSGEYLITNKTGAALEVGQFMVSRVM